MERELDRRRFLASLSIFAGGALAVRPARADGTPATVVAKTSHGPVRGTAENGLNIFKGIPYGGSPAGVGRFKPAPALKPWKDVRDALQYGPQAIQPADPAWPKEWKPAPADEACLYLNVWTPGVRDGKRRPIMFYSHGGGFATGNGGADVWPQNLSHDGAALARSYDVVVVTHNHRLGLMGYLYLGELLGEEYAASGCTGMLDIATALAWVRENAEAFGGDPDRIMIWGESGGGAKTSTLLALPAAKGNFQRASVESGPALRMQAKEAAAETARQVLSKLDLKPGQARELLNMPAERLRNLQAEITAGRYQIRPISGAGMGFAPVVDGHFLPNHPFDPVAPAISAKVPMIVGTNKDETIFMLRGMPGVFSLDEAGMRSHLDKMLGEKAGPLLEVYRRTRPNASPTDLLVAISTAQWMWVNAITMAERKAKQGAAPVYMYLFAYESETPAAPGTTYPAKASHAMEIPFKFNHPETMASTGNRPERIKAARNMSRAWATFARTGNPSHDEIPPWPVYELERRATMVLNTECKVVDDPYSEERIAWQKLG